MTSTDLEAGPTVGTGARGSVGWEVPTPGSKASLATLASSTAVLTGGDKCLGRAVGP